MSNQNKTANDGFSGVSKAKQHMQRGVSGVSKANQSNVQQSTSKPTNQDSSQKKLEPYS